MTQARRRHRILAAAVAGLGMFTVHQRADATLLLYEPFDYTSGTTLGGTQPSPPTAGSPVGYTNVASGQTWYARGTTSNYQLVNDTQIASGSLSYPGLASSAGNSVNYGSGTAGSTALFSDSISIGTPINGAGNSVYYSFLVKINTSVLNARASFISLSKDTSDAGSAGSALTTGSGSNFPQPAGVWMRPNPDASPTFQLGVGKGNTDGIGPNGSAGGGWMSTSPNTPHQSGATNLSNSNIGTTTYFVVAKYAFGNIPTTNGQVDSVSIFVNPAASLFGDNSKEALAPGNSLYTGVDVVGSATVDSDAIRSLILMGHRQNVDSSVAVSLDEIRVGTSWADVTPIAAGPRNLTFDGNAGVVPNPSDTSGNWETASNWYDGSTNVTWASGDNATFGTGAGAGSVTCTLGSPQTAGKVTFAASSPNYTLAGSALTINGSGGDGVVANQSATVAAPVVLAGTQTWTVASGQTLSVGSISGTGSLTKAGSGTLKLTPNGTAAGVSRIATLAVTGGKLDISNNHVISKSAVGTYNGTNYTGLTQLIATGRSGNTWSGSGIVTSQTAAIGTNYTSVGIVKATDAIPATATATALWAGQTITGTDTLIMYTYGGDANLDGKLNVDDYIKIDSGISAGLTGWSNGDFNYDGKVNIDDYTTVIDANIGNQSGVFFTAGGVGAIVAVPEPASMSLIGLSIAAISATRRKRRQ